MSATCTPFDVPPQCMHAPAQAGGAEEDGYPDSVTALLKAAGVLHAVPLGAERFVQDSDEQYSLPDPPRFHFSDNGNLYLLCELSLVMSAAPCSWRADAGMLDCLPCASLSTCKGSRGYQYYSVTELRWGGCPQALWTQARRTSLMRTGRRSSSQVAPGAVARLSSRMTLRLRTLAASRTLRSCPTTMMWSCLGCAPFLLHACVLPLPKSCLFLANQAGAHAIWLSAAPR